MRMWIGKEKNQSESGAAAGAEKKPGQRGADPAQHDWMTPVEEGAPCGADIEYDPEFVVLSGRVAARMEEQYGDFVGMPEAVNWAEVDRDCRRLMMRSKDIRLATLFARCRTRQAGADGLAEGLELLYAWLYAFPANIHPQMNVDEDRQAALEIRMNALQVLTDPQGLLADVREIVLSRSVIARLQVRDVERAFAQPRPNDALTPESVTRQLDDIQSHSPAKLNGFVRAQAALASIVSWCKDQMGDCQPDFLVLSRLLDRIVGDRRSVVVTDDDMATEETGQMPEQEGMLASEDGRQEIDNRYIAQQKIAQVREWFEKHEPSSPVAVLLRQAEYLVGKRYAEVYNVIPQDLLAKWENEI